MRTRGNVLSGAQGVPCLEAEATGWALAADRERDSPPAATASVFQVQPHRDQQEQDVEEIGRFEKQVKVSWRALPSGEPGSTQLGDFSQYIGQGTVTPVEKVLDL